MPSSFESNVLQLQYGRETESALLALFRLLARARSETEVMTIVSSGVRNMMRADGATFVLRDGDRCHYAEEDAISPLWRGRRFPMSGCISGWCMTHRQPVAVPDIYQDARIPADTYRPTFVKSLALAPVGRDAPIAAIGAYWSRPHQASAGEIELLQAIADAAELAVINFQRRPPPRASDASSADESVPQSSSGVPQPFLARPNVTHRLGKVLPILRNPYVVAVLGVSVATLIRGVVGLTGTQHLTTLSTYYPVVVLSMLIGGKRSAILAAVLGALASDFFFLEPLQKVVTLSVTDALNLTLYGGACATIILAIDWYQRALACMRLEDARHLMLAREQHHRILNATHVIEVIVRQSLKDDPVRARLINQRIRAGLSDVDIRSPTAARSIGVGALLAKDLEAFGLDQISLDGPDDPPLPGRRRSLISLVAHELGTNALKYGALSTEEGRVAVNWRIADGILALTWRESGGPRVGRPQRRGAGTIMLQRMIESIGGTISVEYPPTGVVIDLTLPLGAHNRRSRRAEAEARVDAAELPPTRLPTSADGRNADHPN